MKTIIAALIISFLGFEVSADNLPKVQLCPQRDEDQYASILFSNLKNKLVIWGQQNSIPLIASSISLNVVGATYGIFGIWNDLTIEGDAQTVSGTKLLIDTSGDLSWRSDLSSSGFDHEGNAINPHCKIINTEEPDDQRTHQSFVIRNADTKKVLGKINAFDVDIP